jgi:hypothetical protein
MVEGLGGMGSWGGWRRRVGGRVFEMGRAPIKSSEGDGVRKKL